MVDFATLPASVATETFIESLLESNSFIVTYTEKVDEQRLYKELTGRLTELEKSIETNHKELGSIETMTKELKTELDLKDDIELRINGMLRLYEAKYKIEAVDSIDKAKEIRKLITTVQTCPLKKNLTKKLSAIMSTLKTEKTSANKSTEQSLMEKAIEEAGNEFINLGKVGREYVIAEAISKYQNGADVQNVTEHTRALEQNVEELKNIQDPKVLRGRLKDLPLKNFSTVSPDRLDIILEQLIKNGNWNGLASLDRLIKQLDNNIARKEQEEEKNKVLLKGGKVDTIGIDVARNHFIS